MKKMIAAALIAVLGTLGVAAPAVAAQTLPTNCPDTTFCLHEYAEHPYGRVVSVPASVGRNTCIPVSSDWHLTSYSFAYNRTGLRWYLYRTFKCTGAHIEVPPYRAGPIAVFGGPGWDNRVVAVIRTSSTR
jgi:hypothetical protein